MVARPYGSWSSPITSDLVVADAIRLDQVALDGDAIYWTESQPQKQGRCFVYRAVPKATSLSCYARRCQRTSMSERGCTNMAAAHSSCRMAIVYFSNFADQRLYRQEAGQAPRPITPAPSRTDALRYADGVIDRRRDRIICVHEDHTLPGKVDQYSGERRPLGRAGAAILARATTSIRRRVSVRTAARLAWLTWNHPNMPWVTTEAWVGEVADDGTLAKARRVAGGPDEALFQPEWSPDGDLYFVSDRGSGWWNLYRERGGATRTDGADGSRVRTGRNGLLACRPTRSTARSGSSAASFRTAYGILAKLDHRTRRFDPIDLPFTRLSQLRASPGRAVFIGGSPAEPTALIDLDLGTGTRPGNPALGSS